MKVKLKSYSNPHNYEKNFEDKEEVFDTVNKALDYARKNIREVKNTNSFLGYKMFDFKGKLIHKLPSY